MISFNEHLVLFEQSILGFVVWALHVLYNSSGLSSSDLELSGRSNLTPAGHGNQGSIVDLTFHLLRAPLPEERPRVAAGPGGGSATWPGEPAAVGGLQGECHPSGAPRRLLLALRSLVPSIWVGLPLCRVRTTWTCPNTPSRRGWSWRWSHRGSSCKSAPSQLARWDLEKPCPPGAPGFIKRLTLNLI